MKNLRNVLASLVLVSFMAACGAEKIPECTGVADAALGPDEDRAAVMADRDDNRALLACKDCCESNGYSNAQTRMRGDEYIECHCVE